jgi:6-phosphogluconolactonase
VVNHDDATVTGFTVSNDGKLSALARSTQTLVGGANADPAQVKFTPDGTQLVVTEKGTNVIDVLAVDDNGRAVPPVKNNSSGRVPFACTFAGKDLLIVSELTNATSSYRIAPNGMLTVVSGSVSTAERGACWVVTNSVADPRFAYVSNAVSGSISGYRIDATGVLSLLSSDGHSAITRDTHATLDSAVSSDGRFLYVLTGGFNELSDTAVPCNKMTISAFRIETDGSLDTLPGFGTSDTDTTGNPRGLAPGTQGIVAV